MHASIIIDQIVSFSRTYPEVNGLALLGSHARGDAGPWADVDLVLLVARKEAIKDALESCVSFMSSKIKHVIRPEPNKWVILTNENCLRIDMTAIFEVSDIEVIYRSSRIPDPKNAVLVDKGGKLMMAFEIWSRDKKNSDLSILVSNEVEKFIDSFEASSRYAQQGDVFRFYFNYNLSLTRYGRLVKLAQDIDAFLYTPRPDVLNEGRLFRSSTLSRFEQEREYDTLLDRMGIQRIIDLRYDHERARYPYSDHTSNKIEIVQLSMGKVPDSKKVFGLRTGNNHVFMLDNSLVFKRFFSLLAEGIPTLVHCHSGKHRTGVLIAPLYLALGFPVNIAYRDFLASGMDLTEKDADEFFGRIEELGGIDEILNRLGVDARDVRYIRKWLLK